MIAEVVSTFEANINGIVFLHEEWYEFIKYVIGRIEEETNVEVSYSFVKDVRDAFEDYFDYDADFYSMYENIDTFLYVSSNIKDLDFIFDCSDKFDEINRKVKDWDNTYGKEPEL